jgi:hypothetical protein
MITKKEATNNEFEYTKFKITKYKCARAYKTGRLT